MDPITASVVSALVLGLTQVGNIVIPDAYNALKAIIEKRFGKQSDIISSMERLEKDPNSEHRKGSLQEDIAKAKADQYPDILQAAQVLLAQISVQPGGKEQIQKAIGDYNIQVQGSGNTINQTRE